MGMEFNQRIADLEHELLQAQAYIRMLEEQLTAVLAELQKGEGDGTTTERPAIQD